MSVKPLFTTLLIVSSLLFSGASFAKGGSHSIRGHTTKKGTYVAPSHATNPNKTKRDNYSQKGNVNPHTGKEGSKQ